jgi:IS4 transposase
VGYFWSGCASAAKHGLEILDIAVIDADEKDAVHLKAVQTVDTVKAGRPPKYLAGMKTPNSLTAWYLRALARDRDALRKVSDIVAADAFFSKEPFVNGVTRLGFRLVSRFRSDVSMRYLYTGPKTGKRGRPKEVDGKVYLDNLRTDVFREESYDDSDGRTVTLHTAVVRATSLKRDVRVVVVDCMEPGKKTQARKVFFSTDTGMSAKDIMDLYRTRFQIEFLLRDGKQFTGLTHCQSRQKEALAFHFNMSLTAVNVARAFARQDKKQLSVANVKTLIHYAMMIRRFFMLSGKLPNKLLNTCHFKELLYYGVADAA